MTDNSGQQMDLSTLISETAYQNVPTPGAVTPVPGANGVAPGADTPPGGAGGEGLSPAGGNVQNAPTGTVAEPGVTPQAGADPHGNAQQPIVGTDPRDAQIAELTETITNQSREYNAFLLQQQQTRLQEHQAKLDADFEASIADLDPTEQRAARAERQANVAQVRLQAIQQQAQQQAHRSQVERQQHAKRELTILTASEHGIPLSLAKSLMGAESYDEMVELAKDLAANLTPMQQQQAVADAQAQQQVQRQQEQFAPPQQFQQYEQNPALAGGGDVASGTVPEGPAPGSGDLKSLIASTPYMNAGSY